MRTNHNLSMVVTAMKVFKQEKNPICKATKGAYGELSGFSRYDRDFTI